MNVLILSLNFLPEKVGIGRYSGEMAHWLAARGHRVAVLTAPPYYPQWQIQQPYRNRFVTEHQGALEIRRAPLWVPHQPGALARLLHLASFSLSALVLLLQRLGDPPDRLIVVAPALFSALPALLFRRICRWLGQPLPCLLHVQDFELDAAFELGFLRQPLLRSLATGFEAWLLRRFDAVSTLTRAMAQRLHHKGVAPHAIRLFPNWVHCDDFTAQLPAHSATQCLPLRHELGIPANAVVALYAGSMGRKQGLEILVSAARQLPQLDQLWWVFCGEGPSRPVLELACTALSRVLFLPLQEDARFCRLMQVADLHLLPQQAGAADLVMPSKLLAMLASGRPVVASAPVGTELARVLRGKPPTGLLTPPGDGLALAKAVEQLVLNPALRQQLGEAARQQARQHWDRDGVLSRFEQDLHELGRGLQSASSIKVQPG